jgi:hypothetical protein
MTYLTDQQKNLLFDYCIGVTSQAESAQAEELIFSNADAAELVSKLKSKFAPLNSLEPEICPDQLAENTIARLNELARASQKRLEHLIAVEQSKTKVSTIRILWGNFSQLAAAAAIILVLAGAYFPSLRYARAKSWEQQCQMQLGRIGQGLADYRADHDGQLPSVAMLEGQPWWKVGYQGNENQSNTRNIWQLAKGNYVDATDFVCPGRRQGRVLKFDTKRAKDYNDFPDRRYVTYSFRIRCNKSSTDGGQKVIMADLNPHFEKLPCDYKSQFMLQVNNDLMKLNSTNHAGRGQNLLFCNGGVRFVKERSADITKDDIYTLQNTSVYRGVEMPKCETDAFLAP